MTRITRPALIAYALSMLLNPVATLRATEPSLAEPYLTAKDAAVFLYILPAISDSLASILWTRLLFFAFKLAK